MHVILEFARAHKADDPYAMRFTRETYLLRSEGGGTKTAALDWNQDLLEELDALRGLDFDAALVQRVGNRLREFLRTTGWAHTEAAIIRALDRNEPVYITVRSTAAEIYALPWELLTITATGQHLGELPQVLIRYAWPETRTVTEDSKPRTESGRIVLAWSAAGGPVPTAKHRAAIAQACQRGHYHFDPEDDVIEHVSLGRLRAVLEAAAQNQQSIAVLHLLSHGMSSGQTFGLGWNDDEGDTAFVDAGRLRQLLAPHAGRIGLVVLAACDSGHAGTMGNHLGSMAQALHRAGIQAVVASRFPLSTQGSIRLTETLYNALLGDVSALETAFLAARRSLAEDASTLDWASMQLYVRPEDGDDTRPVVFRPYRGLLAFQAEHTRFFFGRDRERAKTLGDLRALGDTGNPRLLVVAGASGTGKSSMVLGGAVPDLMKLGLAKPDLAPPAAAKSALAPADTAPPESAQFGLRAAIAGPHQGPAALGSSIDSHWEYAVVRLGCAPMTALETALAGRSDPTAPFLLVIDQFEELFTHTQDPALRQRFGRRLWDIVCADTGVSCIITIRVDFLGACGEIVLDDSGLRLDRVAYEEAHRVFVAQMTPEQLRSAIEEPAHKVGLKLEHGLVDSMLVEVGNEPGTLPLLQYTLDLLWQRRQRRMLTTARYRELGGVVGALQKKADSLIDSFASNQRRQARRLLVRLIGFSDDQAADTRRRMTIAQIRPAESAEQVAFDAVLNALVEARLLVCGAERGQATVEVAHEALIRRWPRLRQWLHEDRDKLAELHEIQAWVAQCQAFNTLLKGAQLGYAMRVRDKYPMDLDGTALSVICASEAQERKEAARARRRVHNTIMTSVTVAAVMVMLVVFIAYAWNQAERQYEAANRAKIHAREQERRALTRAQEAENAMRLAAALSVDDPAMSAILLREVRFENTAPHGWVQAAVDALQQPITQRILSGPGGAPVLAATGDGTKVVVESDEFTVLIWRPYASDPPISLRGHSGAIIGAEFSTGGGKVLTFAEDRTARVWNSEGVGAPQVLRHRSNIVAAALSRDGNRVVTVTQNRRIRVWNLDAYEAPVLVNGSRPGHRRGINSVAFSPDGRRVITGSEDRTARIWTVDGSAPPIVLAGHTAAVTSVAFCPNGRRVVTASRDRSARLWQVDEVTETMVFRHQHRVLVAAFASDGRRVITATSAADIRAWSLDGSGDSLLFRGHKRPVRTIAVSRDGTAMVTVDVHGEGRLWRLRGSDSFSVLYGHSQKITAAEFSPKGNRALTVSLDGRTWLWDLRGQGSLLNRGHLASIYAVAFSTDGTRAVTAVGSWAWIWDVDGSQRIALRGHTSQITEVAFSPEGSRVLTASYDWTARVWNADGRGRTAVLHHPAQVVGANFSSDGRRIVTTAQDGLVRVWNGDGTGAPVVLGDGQDPLRQAEFGVGDTRVVTGSEQGAVQVWNADGTGDSVLLGHHRGAVSWLALSADGTRVVTASDDETAWVWSIDGSRSPVPLRGHTDSVLRALFSPDGTRVFTASADGTVKMWNIDSRGMPIDLCDRGEAITALAVSPDGKHLLWGSESGAARVVSADVKARSLRARLEKSTPLQLDSEQRVRLLGDSMSSLSEPPHWPHSREYSVKLDTAVHVSPRTLW